MVSAIRLLLSIIGLGLMTETALASDETDSLPLTAQRRLDFVTDEGTWMALDVSPDGRTILFDLLGDIYALDTGGGEARPLLQGMAFETHPVFSPDGETFAFISDRSGSANLWVASVDGGELKQLSFDEGATFFSSPAWSADGRSVYVSRAVHYVLAFELFRYGVEGGEGERITNAKPSGHEGFDARHNALGAVASPDGRYLYYATKHGSTWSDNDPPNWSIARKDLASGEEDILVSTDSGGGMRPALSHDGRYLAYGSRFGVQTGLRLRDLETGEDRWLVFPIDHDGQQGGYYSDLLPRFAFTPDDREIVFSRAGKFRRISLREDIEREIPFTAKVELGLGPQTRVEQPDETGPVKIRVIEEAELSPDGTSIVFSGLGGIYIQDLQEGAAPKRISEQGAMAFQPSWSPDGARIVYVTWSAKDAGHVWSTDVTGGATRRLSQLAGFYYDPVFSPKGDEIAVVSANHYERLHAADEIRDSRPSDIIRMPASGGEAALVARAAGARLLQFSPDGARIRFYAGRELQSLRRNGTDLKTQLKITAQNWNQYFADQPAAPEEVKLSPRGDMALAKAASQLYLLRLPSEDKDAISFDLAEKDEAVTKLTDVGADFFGWSADGQTIYWSVGSTFRMLPSKEAAGGEGGGAEQTAQSFSIDLELPRDVPRGAVLLRGATAITMNADDEVIKNADILVVDNRIAAVGKRGSIAAPAGVDVRNVKGKYILPGFVDTHAHWFEIRRKLHDRGHWDFLANLAYGVTSGLDVQPFTVDVFSYQDMIDAGLMIGPRAFSTGPGVFVNSRIDSKQQAVDVLTRYREHYHTRNIKSYMVGGREQRQHMIEAAAELGMAPTTEGASDLWLNLTHAIDGFAGNEHTLPVTPLHKDVIRLFAQSRIAYTPTLIVMYGGVPAWDEMMVRHQAEIDDKLRRFIPALAIHDKLRNLNWNPPASQTYDDFAHDALMIQRAGGLVGMGSHGTLQGLGYHWELEAYASGGATPYEVLKAATIGSSEVIGRADQIGSLEPGKYADLLILERNPLDDVSNALSLDNVMKNGRLYEAETLDEVWPRQRPLDAPWFADDAPEGFN